MKEKKNDDTNKVLIPTGGDPVSNDTVIKDNAEDNDKNGASGTDIVNHIKELEIIEEDTRAMIKSHPNKAKITRKSSFRITSVIDTASTEEEEVESDLEEDITETTNMPVVTPDSMVTDNPSEKPLASNTVNREEGNGDFNPRVESHHTHTGKAEHALEKM